MFCAGQKYLTTATVVESYDITIIYFYNLKWSMACIIIIIYIIIIFI